jgi:hypothetical protein
MGAEASTAETFPAPGVLPGGSGHVDDSSAGPTPFYKPSASPPHEMPAVVHDPEGQLGETAEVPPPPPFPHLPSLKETLDSVVGVPREVWPGNHYL